jgi:hypothetical protein
MKSDKLILVGKFQTTAAEFSSFIQLKAGSQDSTIVVWSSISFICRTPYFHLFENMKAAKNLCCKNFQTMNIGLKSLPNRTILNMKHSASWRQQRLINQNLTLGW